MNTKRIHTGGRPRRQYANSKPIWCGPKLTDADRAFIMSYLTPTERGAILLDAAKASKERNSKEI